MASTIFKDILVPYDGSKNAFRAFDVAVDIAKKYNSNITVLTCITKPAYRGTWYHDASASSPKMKKEEKAAEEKISKMIEPVKKKTDLSIKHKIIPVISATNEISSFAKSHKMDLVVMGAHGKTGLEKILLGSISQGVSQKSHCSVMIVK
ncbi:universal stress protein [Nitrosopumilus sp.]|uniref:universal stress protein n=1 Tax=Nitrosopumilus sp. TaxID=2024843 RepID=UPI00262BD17D|nr:universal stress protein [Nitrosopumilus sp.]